jgi:hypothetical protein
MYIQKPVNKDFPVNISDITHPTIKQKKEEKLKQYITNKYIPSDHISTCHL